MGSCVSSSVEKRSTAVKQVPFNGSAVPPDSEDEMFFDSRAWLDSDCEDDFFSVDGESSGTTPVHHNFTMNISSDQLLSVSLADSKKRLVELFRESHEVDADHLAAESKVRTCLWLRTPARSSAPATPTDSHRRMNRCVPRLVSCSSFTDRRRKIISPPAVAPPL
ncbi:PREDICTED: uncharacterized protein At3g27210 [Tarenaya hassleriana]|uniref:uncharacterized protein At3g27210 n=1 Tax=Tarenaya hassleriana TaxID=28532 RepID=UPI00053C2F2F|nr:PREDICTED: uncharacterized protein At3g27210 [Tarenaya hassleriana]